MVGNSREVKGGFCNCCTCCCDMRMGAQAAGDVKLGMLPSRFRAIIDISKCQGNMDCVSKCPFGAIKMNDSGNQASVDNDKCIGCGTCVLNCSQSAIHMEIVRPASHIPQTGSQHIADSLHL